MRFRTFAVIAVVMLAVAILTWGPWNTTHVAPNPGPSGTPGSTVLDRTHRQPPQPQGRRADRNLYRPLVWFEAGRLSVTHLSACCEPSQQAFSVSGLRYITPRL